MKENKNLSKAHKKNSCGELNKNIISLKKIFQHKKSRIEQKKNLRNKLMLSFENSNIKNLYISKSNVIYNTTFKNSNNNLNTIKINNQKKRIFKNIQKNYYIFSSLTTPISTKHKKFSTINTSPINYTIHTEKREKITTINFKNKNNILSRKKNYKKIKTTNNNNKIILSSKKSCEIDKNIKSIQQKNQNKYIVINGKVIKTVNNLNKKTISTLLSKNIK